MDILKRYNNNGGGSCDIESIRKYIEKEVLQKSSPSSLAIENASLNPPVLPPSSLKVMMNHKYIYQKNKKIRL
jgi:hypothetical protein